MRFGFYLPNSGPTAQPDSLSEIARRGDQLGFDCMVAPDHIIQPTNIESPYPYTVSGNFGGGARSDGEWPEQLTTLAFLAGITQRIRLVTSVMIVPYRNPILTAKMLATIDMLSKGRLTVGVGVGWMEEEFEALDAPPFAKRGAVTDEYLRAFKELWTSDDPHFEGEFCSFSGLSFLPKPTQKPHPPIWVGGQRRRAIRRAAQLGDAWHPVGAIPAATLEPEELSEKVAILGRYAEKAGRDPGSVEVAMKAPLYDTSLPSGVDRLGGDRRRFSGSPDEVLQDVQTYSDIGVGHLIFDIRGADLSQSLEKMEWFSKEVMAHA